MRTRAGRLQFCALVVAAAIVLLRAYAQAPSGAASARTVSPTNEFVDPVRCAQCHEKIAATFRQTGMGRSFSRATAQNMQSAVNGSAPFFHEASHTYFET